MTESELKIKQAKTALSEASRVLDNAEKMAVSAIKDVVKECGDGWCPIGDETSADDIFKVYAEPIPNEFRQVIGLRYDEKTDQLQVLIKEKEDDTFFYSENGWIPFDHAYVSDIGFLLEELMDDIEFADGYYID